MDAAATINLKISWGRAPRPPSPMGPTFIFAQGLHNPLGGPAGIYIINAALE